MAWVNEQTGRAADRDLAATDPPAMTAWVLSVLKGKVDPKTKIVAPAPKKP